jgi:ppGpp synthetase/RelA/SpoT-type nucleotidyltranferase
MNFEQYKVDGFPIHREFASVVARILREAIAISDNHFAIWEIQSRAKAPKSLEGKLRDRGFEAANDIEAKIKDLAGCRIIFYSNDDVLRNYEGETFLHEICRQIVIALPEDDQERRVEVEIILQKHGSGFWRVRICRGLSKQEGRNRTLAVGRKPEGSRFRR